MEEACRTHKGNMKNPYKIVDGEFEIKREFGRLSVDRSKITKFISSGLRMSGFELPISE